MQRYKLIQKTPLYKFSRSLVVDIEKLLVDEARQVLASVPMPATSEGSDRQGDDVSVEICAKDDEGEMTLGANDEHSSELDNPQIVEISVVVTSERAGFEAAFFLHRENPFDNFLHIRTSGKDARRLSTGIHSQAKSALRAHEQPESSPSFAVADPSRAFTIKKIPSLEFNEADFCELERALVKKAAEQTRLPSSTVASELRVSMNFGEKTEEYRSISRRDRTLATTNLTELSLNLWTSGEKYDKQKFQIDINLNALDCSKSSIEVNCVGEGSAAVAKHVFEHINQWIKDHRNDHSRWFPRGLRVFVWLLAVYSLLGSLAAFLLGWIAGGVLFLGLGAAGISVAKYGPRVWPYLRLKDEKEERRYSVVVGRFHTFVGSVLLMSVIMPVVLHLVLK